MATGAGSTKRAVQMTVEVGTSGGAEVRKLGEDIRRLGKDGGDAGAEFDRLANELDKIAAQADAVKAIAQIDSELAKAEANARQATEAVDNLSKTFAEASTRAKTSAENLAAARVEEQRITDEIRKHQNALALLSAETSRADKLKADYVQTSRAERVAIAALNAELLTAAQRRRAAKVEADAASEAESKLAKTYKTLGDEATRSTAALRDRNEALSEAQIAAGKLGVDTTSLVAAQVQLTRSAREVALAAEAQRQSLADLAAQEAEATAIQQKFDEAVKKANAAFEEQVASLKQVEAALEQYNAAQAEAVSQGERDLNANEARIKAAERLIEADRRLSASQRELADTRDKNRQSLINEARAQVDAARAAEQSLAATQRLVTESRLAGQALEQAFGVTGVRSLNAIEAEIAQTEAALSLLERKFRASAISAQDLERATAGANQRLAQLQAEIVNVPKAPGVFERMSNDILSLTNRFGALGAAAATFGVVLRPLVEAQIELQRLQRVLTTVTGSTQKTAETIEFLRDVSQQSGQSFTDSAEAFSKFAAAAVNAGVPLETVKTTFESTAKAAGNLGLDTQATGRILNALGQIASKGVVSMEELRGQLGESLPGALALTAKSLGLTTQELTKQIEAGQLLATDAIPAIGQAMVELGSKSGAVDGIVASFNRFINVVKEAGTIAGEGAIGEGIGGALRLVSAAIERVIFGATMIGESFTVVGKQIGVTMAAVVSGDFKNLSAALAEIEAESAAKLGGLANRIAGVGASATAAAAPVRDIATATERAAEAARTSADSFRLSMQAQVDTQAASTALADAQARVAAAMEASRGAAAGSTTLWPQVTAAYAAAITEATNLTQVTDKLAQAKKAEGDALIAVAEISGNEIEIQIARAKAATDAAAALRAQADADASLVAAYEAKRVALLAVAEAEGGASEDRKKAITELDQLIAKTGANAEKTNEQALALEREAAARRAGNLALADNSKNLEAYRAELERSENAALKARVEFDAGIGSRKAIADADLRVAESTALVKDALNDTTAALARNVQAIQNKADVTLAALNVQKAQLQAEIAIAEADGNSTLAIQKKIELKELEIKILEASVAAKQAEVIATRLQIEADKAALEQSGQLTDAKRAEIEARLANLRVKELEAQQAQAGLAVLQKQIETLRLYGSESRNARTASAAGIERETTAIDRNTEAYQRNTAAAEKAIATAARYGGGKVDAQGNALNTAGGVVNAQGVDSAYVLNLLKSFGLSDAQAVQVARGGGFLDSNGRVLFNGQFGGTTLSDSLQRAARQFQGGQAFGGITNTQAGTPGGFVTTRDNGTGTGGGLGASGTVGVPERVAAPAAAITPDSTFQPVSPTESRRIVLQIGTISTTVDVTSESEADRLEAFLRQLQDSVNRASI